MEWQEIIFKLIEKSYAPTHNEVLPYTRVLMLNKYSITEDTKDLLKGKKSKDNNFYSSLPFFKNMFNKNYNKIIGVAEWSLSEKEKTENSRKKIGDIYSLDLLPFNKINQLQNEYVSDTINDSYDLEVYFAKN